MVPILQYIACVLLSNHALAAGASTGRSAPSRPGKLAPQSQKEIPLIPPTFNVTLPAHAPEGVSIFFQVTEQLKHFPIHEDVFGRRPDNQVLDQQSLFQSATPDEWIVLACTVGGLLLLDVFVLQRIAVKTFKSNLLILFFWVGVGFCYNAYFWGRYGAREGMDWTIGYALEWLLSMDNLFVFHLIFKTYKTPKQLLHKALFFGIVGAVFFKVLFFLFVGELIHVVHWLRFVFGALLIYSGVQAANEADEDEEDMEDTWAVRMLKRCFGSRLSEHYDTERGGFFKWEDGQLRMTLLVHVVCCLELTDVLFAMDSVSAKVAQIPNQYVAYSSSVFAMFGLRAMFFIVKDLVDLFELLKYGICVILCFIGFELMLSDYIQLESSSVCFVILSVFMVCIMGSVLDKKTKQKAGLEQDALSALAPPRGP